MQPQPSRAPRQIALRPLVIAACAAAVGGGANAQADDPNPYYIGVSQAFTHDSNVFRLPKERDPEGGKRSDNYSTTGVLAGIDQPFGRQRFYANGNVRYSAYQDNDDLNNVSYGLLSGLDWSTINRLSGDVKLALNQNLATYSTTSNNILLTKKNTETDGQFRARAQWGLVSLWSLEGIYTHQLLRYSAHEYRIYETNQDSGSLGVKYRPSGLLTLGLALRHTGGDYPHPFLDNDNSISYKRNDIDLTSVWVVSGLSTVEARLSFGKQRYDDTSDRDFSGTTGSLTWLYKPTGKLSFNTMFIRDTGQESSFQNLSFNGSTIGAVGDNSRISTTVGTSAAYAATGKINVNAGFRYIHRSLSNIQTLSGLESGGEGHDNIQSYTLGVNYAYSRSLQFACNLQRDSRSASHGAEAIGLSYDYSANVASCSAQFTLQQ